MPAVFIAVFLLFVMPALGQELTPMPVTIVPPPSTLVQVPVGDWFGTALGYLVLSLGGVVAWAFRRLPGRISAILLTAQADQLMARALVYGINAVVGATRDKVWTIDVRNQVLKEMVTYALTHGSATVKDFMGRPADIAEMSYSRIDAPTADVVQKPAVLPDAPKPNFELIGRQAEVAADIKAAPDVGRSLGIKGATP
jgi:hypothetical protein